MNPANFTNDYHTPRLGQAPSRVSPPRGPVSSKVVSPYRRIYTQVWASASFRALSAPREPSAQFLFLFLLTSPRTSSIPGVIGTNAYDIAGTLGWSVDGVRDCLAELVDAEMIEVDEAGLVWLPNALHYEKPANPDVVAGWQHPWGALPACPLKVRVWEVLHAHVTARGAAFAAAFARCRQPVLPPPSSRRRSSQTDAAAQPNQAVGHGVRHGVRHQDAGSRKPEATHTHTAGAYTHEASRVETVPSPAVVVEPVPVVVVPPAPPTSPSPVSVDAPPPAAPSAAPTVPVVEVPEVDPAPSHAVAPSAASPVPVAAVPRPRCLSPEAEAILCELERYPSLASIATPRRAEGASTLLVTCGVTLADVLAGLQDLAAKAAMVDWSADTLAQCVPSYAKTAAKNRRALKAAPVARPDARAEAPTPKPVLLLSAARTTPLRPVWSMTSGAPASGATAPTPVDAATARAKLAACHASFNQRSRVETREEKIARQRAALFAAESSATSRAAVAVGGAP